MHTIYRSITINGEEKEFSESFGELHIKSYDEVLKDNGFGLEETRQSIQILHDIRHAEIKCLQGEPRPMAERNW